jgi:Tfp pilus assembly protein PilX
MNWLPKAVHSRERGAALIIVLAFVVLLTGVAIAYLSRATSDRQVAHSSFNQSNVDQLAQSAMDNIIGDLRQEIVNGSTATVVNGITIYTPTATANTTAAANMIPQRSGNAAGVPNLIRRSVRSDPILSPPGLGSRASAVNSTNPADVSANGRTVTSTRWNSHYLVPKGDLTTADSSPIPAFTNATPDWVFVTNSGATVIVAPNSSVIGRYAYALYDEGGLLDMNVAGYPSGTTAVQPGRKGSIAFADLTALPTTPLITQAQINTIVGWRNCASAQPSGIFPAFTFNSTQATTYVNSVLSNTDGFMRVRATRSDGTDNVWVSGSGGSNAAKRTDQMFPDRRSLINLRTASGFNVNALQYLSTFSREANSPSFSPSTPAGSSIDYAALATTSTAINPNFLLRRVTTSFTRFDGTSAAVGEPLVKTRFPLSRLAWITYKGPSASLLTTDPAITQLTNAGVPLSTIQAGTAANIKTCFGLVWDSRAYVPVPGTGSPIGQQWVYDSPSSLNTGGNFDPATNPNGNPASDIKRLDIVASENREADFFELLRATILDGSLGQNTGGGVTGANPNVFPDVHMSNKAYHVLSIGAAIMDQADPDSVPTRIQFKPATAAIWWAAYGVESLPYITEIYPISGISPANPLQWATYLLFQLWNPHIATAALAPAAPQVRVRVDGNIGIFTGGNGQTFASALDPQVVAATGQSIPLTTSAFPPTPPTPTPAPITTTNATAGAAGTATAPCGFERLPGTLTSYIGLRLLPDKTLLPGVNPQLRLYFGTDSTHQFNATMEYNVPGSAPAIWVPYNHFIGIKDPSSWMNGDTVPVRTASAPTGLPLITADPFAPTRLTDVGPPACLLKADPRATRFGIFQMDTNPATTARITDPLWPTSSVALPNGYGGNVADPGGPVEHAPLRFSGLPYFPATLCINGAASTSTRTGYADNDGIIRPSDATYPDPSVATTGSSTPYYATSLDYHPIILNRPFRNVAELGYAFRDLPWKSLDFFTDKSADAGLLDVFCINDGAPVFAAAINIIGMAVPTTVAGSVNLNATQAADIQSVLAGAIWGELDSPPTTVSQSGAGDQTAQTMASRIVPATTTTPMLNRSELITRSGLPLTILPLPATSQSNQTVKARREVVPRAITSLSQTRTWNLLIDVVAQSGQYPPNATNFRNGFVVNGEQRYWVHVAIDRFTGQVIDKQIEVVNE